MSSCFGLCSKRKEEDTEALLPQYDDDTSLQRQLHQKMHTYQMIRALSKGYMPSTEQLIVNLRTLLALDVLNPDNPDLSDSGRLLVKYTKQWFTQFIEMVRHKNSNDLIQDFIWFLTKSRIAVDTDEIVRSASKVRARADSRAAYSSLRTVGSLLLTNSDFRIFAADLGTIGRQVFADTAFSFSEVAQETARKIEPSQQELQQLKEPGSEDAPPSAKELQNGAADLSKVLGDGLAKTGQDAYSSLQNNVSGEQKDTLLYRLKEAVSKLRRRNDYSDSVSTIGLLIKRYAKIYSRAVDETINTAKDDVKPNSELDKAAQNCWALVSSFGDHQEWDNLKAKFEKVMEHSQTDPQFENLMTDVADSVQKLLTDPDFFESADKKIQELRDKARETGTESGLRKDVDDVLSQMQVTFRSVVEDKDISKLISTSARIINILSPKHSLVNRELYEDAIHIFFPLLIQTIQYIPIPRVEVSVPEIDLLLENLIIEPGRTINNSSFLPYKLRVETYNDLEIRKAKFRTTFKATSLVTVKVDGLSIRAEEVGFWLRAHSGIFRLADEGIASFQLDERGIDIAIDVEIGKEKLEEILTLKAVRVHVHKLSYTLRKSKFSWLTWLFKPLLRPIVRSVLQKQLAIAIADGIHFANRELLYARERLRATRISDPEDVRTFIKAIITRLTPEEDPDVYAAVLVQPGQGVFKGVYAPGSLVKLYDEEARKAAERVDDAGQEGWRNEIFDVQAISMGQ